MFPAFFFQVLIIKFCGKKTPLVRRKRRRTVHHPSSAEAGAGAANIDSSPNAGDTAAVQIHPTAVEAAVPMGKKVRLGESKGKKDKKRRRSKSTEEKRKGKDKERRKEADPDDDWASVAQGAVVSRAARLAANLSNLIVSIPDGGVNRDEEDKNKAVDNDKESPAKDGGERKARRRRRREEEDGEFESSSRHSKSHSPEKTIAAGIRRSKMLAERVAGMSKSFEKLDDAAAGGGERKRRRRRKEGEESRSRTRRRSKSQQQQQTSKRQKKKGDEMTIAKLGPFKFSLEVKDQQQKAQQQQQEEKARQRKRSSPRKEEVSNRDKQSPSKRESSSPTPRPKANVLSPVAVSKAPPLNTRSVSLDNSGKEAAVATAGGPLRTTGGGQFMVTKQRPADRPLRSRSQVEQPKMHHPNTASASADQQAALLDFLAASSSSQTAASHFPRSVSYTGSSPTSPPLSEMLQQQQQQSLHGARRKYSLAGLEGTSSARPRHGAAAGRQQLYRLKRSTSAVNRDPTAAARGLGNAREDAFLLLPGASSSSSRKTSAPAIVVEQHPQPSASRISSLKRHLQSQWDQNAAPAPTPAEKGGGSRSLNSTLKRNGEGLYETIGGEDDDDDIDGEESDSSCDSKQRLSPPTQVQSLSEMSSDVSEGTTGRNKGRHAAKNKDPSDFGSEDDDEEDEDESDDDLGEKSPSSPSSASSSEEPVISRKRILAAVAAEQQQKQKKTSSTSAKLRGKISTSQSRTELLKSESASISSSSSDAANAATTASSKSSLVEEEEEDVEQQTNKSGCDGAASGENLDYIKKYGEVPRMLQQQGNSPATGAAPMAEEEEDESMSILND